MNDRGKQLLEARIAYLRAMYEAVPLDVWRKILQECVKDAEAGDRRAARFLGKYLLPSDLELVIKLQDTEV